MATPKRRHTKSRRDMRRANHDKIDPPNVVPCANCAAPTLLHRVCATCGFYKGKSVISSTEG